MASYGWGTHHSVADWLFADSASFDFFQAVGLLQLMRPSCVPVGETNEPGREDENWTTWPERW